MDEVVAFTEEMLAACRALGRARVVLRNPVGVVEVFADLGTLELRDGWAHLCTEPFHLHLHCHSIAEVHFRVPDGEGASASRAVWFADKNGAPLLLIVLDQAKGDRATEQARVFDALRAQHGPSRPLMSLDALPPRSAMS
ncbi:MAG TPA: ChuX/HutX family heme-like substrate-binding protein [Candidatus Binatia bacterium]